MSGFCDRYKQAVLAAACSGRLTADWREQNPDVEPVSELLQRIQKQHRAMWEEKQLHKMKLKGQLPTNETWKTKYQGLHKVEQSMSENSEKLPESWCYTLINSILSMKRRGMKTGLLVVR